LKQGASIKKRENKMYGVNLKVNYSILTEKGITSKISEYSFQADTAQDVSKIILETAKNTKEMNAILEGVTVIEQGNSYDSKTLSDSEILGILLTK
jgi:hypothetical protein